MLSSQTSSRLKFSFLISFFWIIANLSSGQTIDNMASFRMVDGNRYIRLNVDNDYFTATDDYYTAGINLEMVHPLFRKFPLTKILVAPQRYKTRSGISLEQNGYTPKSIEHDDILYGDRPFAATLQLKTFSMSVDSMRHQRITSSLSLGIIGQGAGGYGVQKALHELIHYTIPRGWQNQIHNDIIINYEFAFEKNLVHLNNKFLINGMMQARAGTLNTRLSSGFVMMIGKLNPSITRAFSESGISAIPTKKFRFHVYLQPLMNIVGYDATLQGGFFNRDSPYTISQNDLTRITFQANYGFVLSFKSIYLEYFKSIISKEFVEGDFHRWGGVRIGVKW
ncbi:MAG: lipid A deacylase LpxR family protein [Cyclobacteriaceae bacterium]|nr:lipid A deacylase LpxR family protein [Cyclobacteriaceae bacterium]